MRTKRNRFAFKRKMCPDKIIESKAEHQLIRKKKLKKIKQIKNSNSHVLITQLSLNLKMEIKGAAEERGEEDVK